MFGNLQLLGVNAMIWKSCRHQVKAAGNLVKQIVVRQGKLGSFSVAACPTMLCYSRVS